MLDKVRSISKTAQSVVLVAATIWLSLALFNLAEIFAPKWATVIVSIFLMVYGLIIVIHAIVYVIIFIKTVRQIVKDKRNT